MKHCDYPMELIHTPHTGVDPGGPGGPAPLALDFSKSCSFQAIFKGKNYFEQILGSGSPPRGVKTLLAPTDQNPGSAPAHHTQAQIQDFGEGTPDPKIKRP